MGVFKDYGFTNDKEHLEAVIEFKLAAINDGWECIPTYQNESVDRAATLKREGFIMMILTREHSNIKWRYEADIHIWGPDGLSIDAPKQYDMNKIKEGLRICDQCGVKNVDTQRVGFANRVCADCIQVARKKYEFPGWCN